MGGNNGNSDDTDVGIYLDGVYLSRPFVIRYSDFNDVRGAHQLQVLTCGRPHRSRDRCGRVGGRA